MSDVTCLAALQRGRPKTEQGRTATGPSRLKAEPETAEAHNGRRGASSSTGRNRAEREFTGR
eukprot:2731777-Pyramimonas_sp.AAC.1